MDSLLSFQNREMQYSDEQNSNEIGSNISDNEPLSSSLFITPNPTTQGIKIMLA